ncbi:MAG: mechanosensitive ion channel family protein [Gammaproteobacteria bacterium]
MNEFKDWLAPLHQSLTFLGLTLEHVLVTILVLGAAVIVTTVIRRAIRRTLKRARSSLHFDIEYALAVERIAIFALWLVFAIVLLEYWGLRLTALWTAIVSVLSVVGIGLLATWTIASNLTAGALISLTRPFHLGDRIEVLPEGVRGRALERTLLFTVLKQEDGQHVAIPNSLIFQRIIRCESANRRYDMDDYEDSDLQPKIRNLKFDLSKRVNSADKE